MVPDINNERWKDVIVGDVKHKISSFSLQMKINSLRMNIEYDQLSIDDAIYELHNLCVKYERIYKNDLELIFKHN